jgi:hypothetical protein
MNTESKNDAVGVASHALFDLLINGASWKARVSHSWWSNKRRRERDSGLKSVEGRFRTEGEAMTAAEDAIRNRTVGTIDYASAKPFAIYSIGTVAEKQIGKLMSNYFESNI